MYGSYGSNAQTAGQSNQSQHGQWTSSPWGSYFTSTQHVVHMGQPQTSLPAVGQGYNCQQYGHQGVYQNGYSQTGHSTVSVAPGTLQQTVQQYPGQNAQHQVPPQYRYHQSLSASGASLSDAHHHQGIAAQRQQYVQEKVWAPQMPSSTFSGTQGSSQQPNLPQSALLGVPQKSSLRHADIAAKSMGTSEK